jgi:ribose transport system permease protein
LSNPTSPGTTDAGNRTAAEAAHASEVLTDQEVLGLEQERQTALDRRRTTIRLLQNQGLLVVLAGTIVFFWIKSPFFMSVSNWSIIAQISAILGMLAVGQTLLVISGGIDISVGSVVACSSALIAYLVVHGLDTIEATIVVLAGGAGVGLVIALLVVRLNVNPLVTTLGMYSILLGVAYQIAGFQSVPVTSGFYTFLQGSIGQLPWVFVFFVIIWLVGLLIARQTAVGRHIYAIGDSEQAAARAGINTARVRTMLYVMSGMLGAWAGVLTTAQLSTASPDVGQTYLLAVVTAVVLGGTRLSGGRGGLFGTFVAVTILGVVENGLALLQESAFMQDVVLGVLLIAAVLFDQVTSSYERR